MAGIDAGAAAKAVGMLIFSDELSALQPVISSLTAWKAANPGADPVAVMLEAQSIAAQALAAQPSAEKTFVAQLFQVLQGVGQVLAAKATGGLSSPAIVSNLLAALGAAPAAA